MLRRYVVFRVARHRTRPYHFRRIERTAMDRTIVVDAVGVDDETRDDGAIVVDDDYDERVVDDRVFVRPTSC